MPGFLEQRGTLGLVSEVGSGQSKSEMDNRGAGGFESHCKVLGFCSSKM